MNTFPSSTIAGVRAENADMDMMVDMFISDESEVCILHDKPFTKTLSWIEYDTQTSKVEFILEDGDIRNFGIPIDRKYRAYFHNTHIVNLLQWNPATKEVESGMELPLIVHSAA